MTLPACTYRGPVEGSMAHCGHPSVIASNGMVPVLACVSCSLRQPVENGQRLGSPAISPAEQPSASPAKISFCVALMNRGENFLKMVASWQALEGTNHELIVADFGSTDIDLRGAIAGLPRVRIAQLEGAFNRARGLNAAASSAQGELFFFLDADILLPRGFCSTVRAHVQPGQVYFPICYSLHKGSAPETSAPGWWRQTGFGLCGFHRDDFALLDWDESFTKWGGEDNDIFNRACVRLKIARDRCLGLLHLWHPNDRAFKEHLHGNVITTLTPRPIPSTPIAARRTSTGPTPSSPIDLDSPVGAWELDIKLRPAQENGDVRTVAAADFKRLQVENDRRLAEYLRLLLLGLCRTCWRRDRWGDASVEGSVARIHSAGGLMVPLAESCGLDRAGILRWLAEPEHGLMHGLMVGFFAHAVMSAARRDEFFSQFDQPEGKGRKFDAQRYMLGCLVHDFSRVLNGDADAHDKRLEGVFPTLPRFIYDHSSPDLLTEAEPMIVGDRLELLRYPDADKWLDIAMLARGFQQYGKSELLHFFRHVRPAVAKIVQHHAEPWLSHWPELKFIKEAAGDAEAWKTTVADGIGWLRGDHYPAKHFYANGKPFAVNIGRLGSLCLRHHAPLPRAFVGCVAVQDLVECGAKITAGEHVGGRDHPYVGGSVPLDRWVFVYHEIDGIEWLDHERGVWVSAVTADLLMRVLQLLTDAFLTFPLVCGQRHRDEHKRHQYT